MNDQMEKEKSIKLESKVWKSLKRWFYFYTFKKLCQQNKLTLSLLWQKIPVRLENK